MAYPTGYWSMLLVGIFAPPLASVPATVVPVQEPITSTLPEDEQRGAPDVRSSLRHVALLETAAGSGMLAVASQYREQGTEAWKLGIAAFEADDRGKKLSEASTVLWSTTLAPADATTVEMFVVASSDRSAQKLLVSSEVMGETVVLDGLTGEVTSKMPGVVCLDAMSATEGLEAAALYHRGSTAFVSVGIEQVELPPESQLRLGGSIRAGAIVRPRSDGADRHRVLLAALSGPTPPKAGQSGSLVIWRAEVGDDGGLAEQVPILMLQVSVPQERVRLLASEDRGFLMLPDFDRGAGGGAVIPFSVGASAPQEVPVTQYFRDPDSIAEHSYHVPGFGASAKIQDDLLIVGRPGDFERSAVFGFDAASMELLWRLEFPVGQNGGTQMLVPEPSTLIVAGGGFGAAALSENGRLSRFKMSGRRAHPVMLGSFTQAHVNDALSAFLRTKTDK